LDEEDRRDGSEQMGEKADGMATPGGRAEKQRKTKKAMERRQVLRRRHSVFKKESVLLFLVRIGAHKELKSNKKFKV